VTDLRIGILGAAAIAPNGIVKPARAVDGATITAIAARDPKRATAFASRYGIPRVHDDYAALVADPDIDAVYIPLPAGLHAEWTKAAIAAGKHVLCEKPFTANAAQAAEIAAGTPEGLVVMEGFHYRYHPLAARMQEVIAGDLGTVTHVETSMCIPVPPSSNIRYQFDLAGGALLDAGSYALHAARTFGPGEPTVTSATARLAGSDPRIDRATTVELTYPGGATGRARASMWSSTLLNITVRVIGELGTMHVTNFVVPQMYHRLSVQVNGRKRSEKVAGETSYTHQLRAFVAATRGEPTTLTPPADSVITMSLIDAAYRAAGLPLRADPALAG
jgi:predicted dehydrogenase